MAYTPNAFRAGLEGAAARGQARRLRQRVAEARRRGDRMSAAELEIQALCLEHAGRISASGMVNDQTRLVIW